jgi:hypothetical protein
MVVMTIKIEKVFVHTIGVRFSHRMSSSMFFYCSSEIRHSSATRAYFYDSKSTVRSERFSKQFMHQTDYFAKYCGILIFHNMINENKKKREGAVMEKKNF